MLRSYAAVGGTFGAGRVLLVGLLCLFFTACSGSDRVTRADIPPLKLVNSTISKGVKRVGHLSEPVHPVRRFSRDDTKVVSHLWFAHLTGEHVVRWEWYTPKGSLFQNTGNQPLNAPLGRYSKEAVAWHTLPVTERNITAHSGEWRVKIYLDDVLTATEPFVIHPLNIDRLSREVTGIDFGNYYALVIGIDNYKNLKKLAGANRDARAVATLLEENYGFEVTLLQDATREDILLTLDRISLDLMPEDNLLIYYAGHGVLDEAADEGYWLPKDAVQSNKLNWIPNATITTAIKAMAAKHIMVVADSCYAAKLLRDTPTDFSSRGIKVRAKKRSYYAAMLKKRARTVMCSGGLEPVVDSGGNNGHSVFTSTFIDVLSRNNGILDGTQLFTQLRRPVVLNSDQTPEYSDIREAGHDGGDFLFVSKTLLQKER